MLSTDRNQTRTAVGYIRVSTEEQATEGISLVTTAKLCQTLGLELRSKQGKARKGGA